MVTKDFYQEVPINIDVEGTYHNLGAFFDRISRLSRLVNMGTIKVKAQANPTASNTIQATAVATTYVYVDAPPPPPPGAAPAPAAPMRAAGMKHALLLFSVATVGLAAPVRAQAPAASPSPAAGAPAKAEDVTRPPLEAEMEPPGGYNYNAQGRRDPFVSLQRPVAADRGPKTRKPGMEGFLIQEVALKGIVKTTGGADGDRQPWPDTSRSSWAPTASRTLSRRDRGSSTASSPPWTPPP